MHEISELRQMYLNGGLLAAGASKAALLVLKWAYEEKTQPISLQQLKALSDRAKNSQNNGSYDGQTELDEARNYDNGFLNSNADEFVVAVGKYGYK